MIKACDFIDNQNFEYFFSGRTIEAKLKGILQGTIYGRLFRSKEINIECFVTESDWIYESSVIFVDHCSIHFNLKYVRILSF